MKRILVPIFVCALFCAGMSPRVTFAVAAPLASTLGPTNITEKTARANCRINPSETNTTYAWVEWSIGNNTAVYETKHARIGTKQVETGFDLIGLLPSMSYHYTCVAENDRGKDRGLTTYFVTKALATTVDPYVLVRTLSVTAITDHSAIIKGYVSPHGTTNSNKWFEWGQSTAFLQETPHSGQWGTSAEYTAAINNLLPGTTYYFRSVAENYSGKNYGETLSFTTLGTRATAQYSEITSSAVTQNSVTIGLAIEMTGINKGVASIEYGSTRALGSRTASTTVVAGSASSVKISGLQPDTTYYYRAQFMLGEERILSGVKTFHTQGVNAVSRSQTSSGVAQTTTQQGVATQNIFQRFVTVGSANALSFQNRSVASAPSATSTQANVGAQGSTGGTSGGVLTNPFATIAGWFSRVNNSSQNSTPSSVSGVASSSHDKNATVELAGAAASKGVWGSFWGSVSGNNELSVAISTDTTKKPHATVEYNIRVANNTDLTYAGAVLKVIFPKNVIYVGDNTNNEFMVEDHPGDPERTYVLSLGNIAPKERRTITMLGVMTSDTTIDPSARARIEYVAKSGQTEVIAAKHMDADALRNLSTQDVQGVSSQTASTGSLFLPSTLLGWVMFVLLSAALIIGGVNVRAYYLRRKVILEQEKKSSNVPLAA